MFQPVCRYLKKIASSNHILAWKSKGLTVESIKPPAASNNNLAPVLNYINTKSRVKFDGSCLKQDKVRFTHKKVVNIFIALKINVWLFSVGKGFALGKCLFGTVKLTKIVNPDNYKYSGYGIGFDAHRSFSLSDSSAFGKNVTIFGADTSSSVHIDDENKDILILGKGPIDVLDDTALTAEKKCSINFRFALEWGE